MQPDEVRERIRQMYIDHDRICRTQALVAPAGGYLIIEGYVSHDPVELTWCVFVPPGQVRQLVKQGLILLDRALAAA